MSNGELSNPQQTGALANPNRPADLPAHIQYGAESRGMDVVRQNVRPARLLVVQGLSKQEIREKFREGACVAMPGAELISDVLLNAHGQAGTEGAPFFVVPIYCFVEYLSWNPREAVKAGMLPAIRDRSFSPRSEVGRLALNSATWKTPCHEVPRNQKGDEQFVSNQEHLNYLFCLPSHPTYYETPLLYSFTKGEHSYGITFNGLLSARRTDMYANQFMAYAKQRSNSLGRWYGLDVVNPPMARQGEQDMRYVLDVPLFEHYRGLNESFHLKYRAGEIESVYDEDTLAAAAGMKGEVVIDSTVSSAVQNAPKF